MKKLSEEDLMAVARVQSLDKFGDPERRAIYSNCFLMGAVFASGEKKLPDATLAKKANDFANGSYYTKDRIAIGKQAYIDGANYIFKRS